MPAAILQQRLSSVMKIDQQSVSSLEQSSLQQCSNKRFLRTA
jgi:predicted XRE-type DNA-binding protein